MAVREFVRAVRFDDHHHNANDANHPEGHLENVIAYRAGYGAMLFVCFWAVVAAMSWLTHG